MKTRYQNYGRGLGLSLLRDVQCRRCSLAHVHDVTDAAGIKFKHNLGDVEMTNIVEATGPGCCIFDYDNDGYMDIYFVNGRWHPDISEKPRACAQGQPQERTLP